MIRKINPCDMISCEAVVTKFGNNDYNVDIPAINKNFNVKKSDDIVKKSREVIGEYSMIHSIPYDFKIEKKRLGFDQRIVLITLDLFEFKRNHKFLSVKKNCTVPYKLAMLGKEQGINFSDVLTEALQNKLNASDEDGKNARFSYVIQKNKIINMDIQAAIKFEISSSQSEKGLVDLIRGLNIERYARIFIINDNGQTITYLNLDGLKIKCSDNLMDFGKHNHSTKFLQQVLKTINMKFNAQEFNNNYDLMLQANGLQEINQYSVIMEFYK